jgi:hypothetical protein
MIPGDFPLFGSTEPQWRRRESNPRTVPSGDVAPSDAADLVVACYDALIGASHRQQLEQARFEVQGAERALDEWTTELHRGIANETPEKLYSVVAWQAGQWTREQRLQRARGRLRECEAKLVEDVTRRQELRLSLGPEPSEWDVWNG